MVKLALWIIFQINKLSAWSSETSLNGRKSCFEHKNELYDASMLVDSHCHLNFPDFENKIPDVVKRAQDMDVKYMQTICTRLGEFPQILDIANDYDNIW